MKTIFLLLLFVIIEVHLNLYSQNTRFDLKVKDRPIREVLKEIENISEFRFFYSENLLLLNKVVEFDAENSSVEQILDKLFTNSECSYKVLDNRLVVIAPTNYVLRQDVRIKGTVIDAGTQEPLPGVNVVVEGTTIGTITENSGDFTLDLPASNVILVFSFVGYISDRIEVNGRTTLEISLVPEIKNLEEVVVVGYGTRKKETLTGAISNIVSKDIQNTTTTMLSQSIQGRVAGLQIRQSSGEPGNSNTKINIRGFGNPLYVIDGIARGGGSDFERLNTDDIESISILKDASAAIYGLNAANGVIIVTTKKGAKGKTKFHYNTVYGLQTPTDVPKMASAAQFMEMRNDANVNAGSNPFLTKAELDKYKAGVPGYEGIDWYNATMKQFAIQKHHKISAQGGTENISYFTSFGYTNEDGLLKSGDNSYQRYTFRSNVTVKLTRDLDADVVLSGHYDKLSNPGENFFNIFKGTRVSLPTDKVYANENPLFYGMVSPTNQNPVALSDRNYTGYSESKNKLFRSSLALTYSVPFIKGLKFKGLASFDSNNFLGKDLLKSYNLFAYDEVNDEYHPNKQRSPSIITNSNTDNNWVTYQAFLMYNKEIDKKHTIEITAVYEQKESWMRHSSLSREYSFYTNDQIDQASLNNQTTSGSESETANRSYIGRINYDFKGKYLVEFLSRYDGSHRYHPDLRWGFFPAVSGGWRISEENFIRDNVAVFSNLKVKASIGIVGEDAGFPFQYIQGFTTTGGGGYEFVDGSYLSGAASPAIINDKLTWLKSNVKNVGIEIGLFKGSLNIEFDVFQRDRTGLLAIRNVSLPNTFGGTLPQENLNSDRIRGFDGAVSIKSRIGKINIEINGNLSYSRTMNVHVERGPYTSSWDKWKNGQTGRWSDIVWGYVLDGHFQSKEEAIYAPGQNGNLGNTRELPGDFKFRDVNGDGVINGNDMLPIFWGSDPKLHHGISLLLQWKGFDFSSVIQGSGKYTLRFNEVYAEMMAFRGNTPAYFHDRWHLEDPYNPNSRWVSGKWPATRFIADMGSIYKESSVWRKDASYFRLKNVEVGYTLSQNLLKKAGINSIRIYSNAHNIFTLTDPFVRPFDPEKIEGSYNAGFTYPLQKSFNFGIDVRF